MAALSSISEGIHEVISDIRMPTMNGFEFIKKVKTLKPTVKVFFMTAFEIDTNEWSNVLPSVKIDEFIQKPFTLEKIGKLVSTHILSLNEAS